MQREVVLAMLAKEPSQGYQNSAHSRPSTTSRSAKASTLVRFTSRSAG